jgi:hypothetical protein
VVVVQQQGPLSASGTGIPTATRVEVAGTVVEAAMAVEAMVVGGEGVVVVRTAVIVAVMAGAVTTVSNGRNILHILALCSMVDCSSVLPT